MKDLTRIIKVISISIKIVATVYILSVIGRFIFDLISLRGMDITSIIAGILAGLVGTLFSILQAFFFVGFVVLLDIVGKNGQD